MSQVDGTFSHENQDMFILKVNTMIADVLVTQGAWYLTGSSQNWNPQTKRVKHT